MKNNNIEKEKILKLGMGVGGGEEGEKEEEKTKIILTERDREILATCYEHNFLLKSHIESFFSDCTVRRVNFRIQQLIKGGYLERESHPEFGIQELFRLTKSARIIMRQLSSHRSLFPTRLKTNTLFHDALVTSCRLRVSKFWNAQFTCEQVLKAWETPEIPDGTWQFQSGKMIALEVECSDKGRRRFLTRLSYLAKVHAIRFVLYVAPNDRMASIVSTYLKDGPSDQPAGVVRWTELETSCPQVATAQGSIDLLSRREW